MEFRIDIEDSSGNKQGNGPITSAANWTYTARMDKAGNFDFSMPASDPKAFAVQRKRIARAYALIDGVWTEVGAGIIDRIEKQPQADGLVILRVSGDDLIRELTYRSVLNLKLYDGGLAVSHSAALTATSAYAPAGWTFTPDGSPPNDSIYGYFNGETVLAAMVKIADKSQNHFYRGTGRTLIFASTFTASGVRAIQATGDLVTETCAIVSLSEQIDTYDLITRIYPRGSGNADVQLTLRATNRSAPVGYTLSTSDNYIENSSANSTYGRIERQIDFRDIGPIANTDADVQAASNMLFDAALEYLKRNSTELEQATYTLDIAGCSQLLRPMQSIRVVYRDDDADLDIDANLNILESTWRIDASGVYTTGLVVSNADRWPPSDVGTIADNIAAGHVYQALPQLNANSYVTAYTKNVDGDNIAAFRFRFGDEVTQLQQVLFEFQILPFESTIKSVGGDSGGSGELDTGGPSSDTTGSGGNNETGSGGPTSTDSATPLIGNATPEIGNSTPTIGNATLTTNTTGLTTNTTGLTTNTASLTTNTASLTTSTTSLTTSTATLTTGTVSGDTGGTSLTTNTPTGGDTSGDGQHDHAMTIGGVFSSAGLDTVYFEGGANPRLVIVDGSSHFVRVNDAGFHTHTVASHTHTIDSHTHTIAAHSHTIASHSHTLAAHSHTIAAHSHTIAAHSHTIAGHSHTIAEHSHTIAAHSHTITAHSHTIAEHSHTMTAHTHSMAAHTHSLNNHTHSLSESITAIYGIFRETDENTTNIGVMEYRVNGGTWAFLNTATDVGNDWYQLDITDLVMDSTTFRPNQTNNLLEIRAEWAGVGTPPTGATIDAQLSVRNIIQAVAYT